jgi:hypothetical protein
MAAYDNFIREFPETANGEPEKVAAYAYAKMTSAQRGNVSFGQFSKDFFQEEGILTPEADDNFFTETGKKVVTGAMKIPGAIYDSMKDDREFKDVGSVDDEYMRANQTVMAPQRGVGQRMTDIFGDDDDITKAYIAENPTHKPMRDSGDNLYFVDEEGNNMGYPNPPGLFDRQSVDRGVGSMLAFAPAAGLSFGAGVASGAVARGLTAFGANTVTDAATQVAGGSDLDEIDVARSLMVGGITAVPEFLAIPMAKGLSNLTRGLKAKYEFGSLTSPLKKRDPQGVIEMGRQVAKEFDMDLTDAQALKFGKAYIQYGDGALSQVAGAPGSSGARVNTQSMLDEAAFGTQNLQSQKMIVPGTQGIDDVADLPPATARAQAAQSSVKVAEENVSQAPLGTNPRMAGAINDRKTIENVDKMIDALGPGFRSGDKPQVAMARAQRAILTQLRRDKAEIDALYAPAREPGNDLRISPDELHSNTVVQDKAFPDGFTVKGKEFSGRTSQRMLQALQDNGITKLKMNKQTRSLLNTIDAEWDEATTFNQLIGKRDEFEQFFGNAKKGTTDFRALTIMRKEWNTMIRDGLDAVVFNLKDQPGRNAYSAAASALKGDELYTQFAKHFKDSDFAGGVVKKIVEAKNVTSHQLAIEQLNNIMLGVDGYSKATASTIAKGIREVLGPQSEGWTSVRQAALRTLTMEGGEPLVGKALAANLTDFLDGKGASLARTLYTKKELGYLRKFNAGVKGNYSDKDISAAVVRNVENRVFSTAPNWIQKFIHNFFDRRANAASIQIPSAVMNPMGVSPVVATATGEAYERQSQ